MEGGGGIRKAEEHDHQFKETVVHLERSLPLITVTHADVVVPPSDIQLRKERRPAAVHSRESIHKLPDEREWGGVTDGERV